jgi:alcohol dehydrogenase YqhD (iron-dependent ADH family)
VELTDRLIEATMRNIIANVPRVLANPMDYDSWTEVMWSGCVAHNNLFESGRTGDWASHDIEHELSAIYDIAHGAGLAVVFPSWMRQVYKHDMQRFVRFAVEVWGVEPGYWNAERTALQGIRELQAFLISIGMPGSLADLQIPGDRLGEMARKCTGNDTHTVGQFVKLTSADIEAIYRRAL